MMTVLGAVRRGWELSATAERKWGAGRPEFAYHHACTLLTFDAIWFARLDP